MLGTEYFVFVSLSKSKELLFVRLDSLRPINNLSVM